MSQQCPFCSIEDVVLSNQSAFAIYDKFPVNKGHLLIIPQRHVRDFFETTDDERQAFNELLEEGKKLLDLTYSPDGYNIGINCGKAAGQTIFHVHIHLIPRFIGDMDRPGGGVRGVIPTKQKY
ncbi:HIT family protein [Anaerobacillus sp. MEB173]|uniref:HIT family protein n=1 Tax=Anaerobacillus sp. MEB173 TaxID=3383345 RepID=UPI003F91A261